MCERPRRSRVPALRRASIILRVKAPAIMRNAHFTALIGSAVNPWIFSIYLASALGGTESKPISASMPLESQGWPNKPTKHVLIAAIVCVLASNVALGQVATGRSQSSEDRTEAPSRTAAHDSITIAVLRAQNALMREYDQRLLGTVYWSLGSIVVVAGLLFVFGWNANTRAYERDRSALRQDLEGTLREGLGRGQKELNERNNQLEKDLRERFASLEKASTTVAQEAAEAVKRSLSNRIEATSDRILDLEIERLKEESASWQKGKIFTNVLRTNLQIIEKAYGKSATYFRDEEIAESLDRMRHAFREGASPDSSLASDVMVALEKLPPKFHTDIENLKNSLKTSRS
jgi:hypothetical protein